MVFWPRSTVLRRLLPLLTFFTGWSILATWLGLSMPPLAIAYSASPLALLLAFRVNAASSRFIEARQCWGRAVNAARNVAATVAASPLAPAQKEKCCRALCALGWAMKSSLRGDTELEGVLRTLLPEEVAGWVLEQRKTPLALLTLIRQTLANTPLFEGNNAISSTISSGLTELNNCYGTMERIFSTPLSPTYMRHTSRGMLLWLLLLPCAMTGSGSRAILPNVLTVLSVAYVMLGIDEIGIQIEQPFDVLPLHALATMLTLDVAAELAPTVPIPDV
jgi:predicted membrane chloride channel (bestrophin family)|tara:strand:- start:335 stop:1165 length:831 start_codon:yes stop_codon:yes gene_type:complete